MTISINNNETVRNFRLLVLVAIIVSWGIAFSSVASAEDLPMPDIMSADEEINININKFAPTCEIGGQDITAEEAETEAKYLVKCVFEGAGEGDVESLVIRIQLLVEYRGLSWRKIGTSRKEIGLFLKEGFISEGLKHLRKAEKAHGEITMDNELTEAEMWFIHAGEIPKELTIRLQQKVAAVREAKKTKTETVVASDW